MNALRTLLAGFVLLVSAGALAQESPDRSLRVENAWARISPTETGSVSIFFDVLSNADEADTLLHATSPTAGKVILRQGTWKGLDFHNATVPSVTIKSHRRTTFRPAVMEVTLTEFSTQPVVGELITVRLAFKNAGEITIMPAVGNQLLGNRLKR